MITDTPQQSADSRTADKSPTEMADRQPKDARQVFLELFFTITVHANTSRERGKYDNRHTPTVRRQSDGR